MNTSIRLTRSFTAYTAAPRPTTFERLVKAIRSIGRIIFAVFTRSDDPAALRYVNGKYTDSLD
jgi:hypothetical protein